MAVNQGDKVYDMVTQEEVKVLQVEGSRFALSNGEVREIHQIWKIDSPPEKRGLFGRKK